MVLKLSIANLLVVLLSVPFALLMEGLRRKAVARMQNRVGPPIVQPIYDVLKLFKKGESDSLAKENPFFRIIPIIIFLVTLVFFLLIPFPILHFKFDFIFLIYLLVLESALFVLIGFASNNPYSTISSMRELILMVAYEMTFAIVILTIFVFTGDFSISSFNDQFIFFKLPLAFISFIAITAVEVRITPYDTVAAPTEVLENAETEYSGKGLAFLRLADAMKMTFFAFMIAYFFIYNLNPWITILLVPFVVVFFAFMQATTGRYRVDQTFRKLIFFLILAIIELVRIKLIW